MSLQEQAHLPLEYRLDQGDERTVSLAMRAAIMLIVLYAPYLWVHFSPLMDSGRGRALQRVVSYLPGFILWWWTPRAERGTLPLPMGMLTAMFFFLMLIPRRRAAVAGMAVFGLAVGLLNSWAVYLWLRRML